MRQRDGDQKMTRPKLKGKGTRFLFQHLCSESLEEVFVHISGVAYIIRVVAVMDERM